MKTIEQIISETPDATDAEILAAAEALREWRRVPVGEVKLWLLNNNLIGTLYVIRDTSTDPQIKGGLSELLAGLDLFESLDATDTAIRTKALTLAGGLGVSSVISSEQYAAFVSLLKEPNTVTQDAVDRYRRGVLIQPHIDAAAQATDTAQNFIATARQWESDGVGAMPEWSN